MVPLPIEHGQQVEIIDLDILDAGHPYFEQADHGFVLKPFDGFVMGDDHPGTSAEQDPPERNCAGD